MEFFASSAVAFRSSMGNFSFISFLDNLDFSTSRCKIFLLHCCNNLCIRSCTLITFDVLVSKTQYGHTIASFFIKLINSFNHNKTTKLAFESTRCVNCTFPKKLQIFTFQHLNFFPPSFFSNYYSCNLHLINDFTFFFYNVCFHKPMHELVVSDLVCIANFPIKLD